MMTNLVSIAALASTLFTVTSCSSMVGPREELASARVRWSQRAPSSYSMTIFRGCECLPEMAGPATVSVVNGAVSVHYANGVSVPKTYIGAFPDVEGLFDLIDSAQKNHYYKVDVEYDSELGYPVSISLDGDKQMADDELAISVRDFKSN